MNDSFWCRLRGGILRNDRLVLGVQRKRIWEVPTRNAASYEHSKAPERNFEALSPIAKRKDEESGCSSPTEAPDGQFAELGKLGIPKGLENP